MSLPKNTTFITFNIDSKLDRKILQKNNYFYKNVFNNIYDIYDYLINLDKLNEKFLYKKISTLKIVKIFNFKNKKIFGLNLVDGYVKKEHFVLDNNKYYKIVNLEVEKQKLNIVNELNVNIGIEFEKTNILLNKKKK